MVDYKRMVGFGVVLGLAAGCGDDGSGSASEGASSSSGTGSATMQVVTTGDPSGSGTLTDGSATQGSMSASASEATVTTGDPTSTVSASATATATDTGTGTATATDTSDSTGTSGPISGSSSTTGDVCDVDLKCGDLCCSPGELCTEGQCQVDCGGPPPCGPQQDCCADGELCNQGQCVMPAGPCAQATCATIVENECPDGFVCDVKLELCLPSQADVTCKYIPPAADFEPVPNFTWGARAKKACVQTADCQTAELCDAGFCAATWTHLNVAANDMPMHNQSSSIAVVADIDRDCVPEIVFNTYRPGVLTSDGVLRAIRGDNGQKVWTVTDPAWRTDSTASPAIGDIDGSGEPEIIVQGAGKFLLAFTAKGTPLWKSDLFKMATVSGAVSIANIDNDGCVA